MQTLHHLHLLRVLLIALHRVDIQFLSKIQKDKKKYIEFLPVCVKKLLVGVNGVKYECLVFCL